jgi:hypothetical protein
VTVHVRTLAASRDDAQTALARFKEQAAAAQAARESAIAERRRELARAEQLEEWRAQREAVRSEMAAELAGDLSGEQEALLLSTLAAKQAAFAKLRAERRVREERAAALQAAFEAIKAATGVSTLTAITDRFLAHASQR